MVLVRSPKRGPWLRPASPPPPLPQAAAGTTTAAAAIQVGDCVSRAAPEAAAGDKQRRPTLATTIATSSEGSTALSGASAGTKERAVFSSAAINGGTASMATGRDQTDRGGAFSTGSISPHSQLKTNPRLSPPCPRRNSTITYGGSGCFSSTEAATTHTTNTNRCRRPSPPTAPTTSEAPPASACESRKNDISTNGDCREGNTAAARETPLQTTHTSLLPFSRSAARRLARIPPQTAQAATGLSGGDMSTVAGHPISLARGSGGGGRGGSGVRGALSTTIRRFSRGNTTPGEVSTSRKGDGATPQLPHISLAVTNVSLPKRMRYAQQSPRRVTSGRSETSRPTHVDTRISVRPSVPLCRKPPVTAHAAVTAGMAERDFPLANLATDIVGAADYSSAAATLVPSRQDSSVDTAVSVNVVDAATAAGAACDAELHDPVAHNQLALSASAVPATATVGGTTATVSFSEAGTVAASAATAAPSAATAAPSSATGAPSAATATPSAATAAPSATTAVGKMSFTAVTSAPFVSAQVSGSQPKKVSKGPQRVQAIELLRQLPATRSLHDYVQEARRSELLKFHQHTEKGEATPGTADDYKDGAALPALTTAGSVANDIAGNPHRLAPVTVRSTKAKPPHASTTSLTAAGTTLAADCASSIEPQHTTHHEMAASSTSVNACARLQSPARTIGAASSSSAPKASAAVDANITTTATVEAPVMVAGSCGDAAIHHPSRAETVSVRATPWSTSADSSPMATARRYSCSNSNSDKLQEQLVLPRTAEELLREWGPTVENVTQRLCDIREEEKQVTQFIILEGRALRVLRHVTQALERKRVDVSAVHARAAEYEAVQQRAHADSEKNFEIVHRQAEDAAGGQARLEKRLKDTQQKKERLLQLRRQLYEEMFACALLRQKKVELGKQLLLLKHTSADRESRRNALFQLLQRITRLRLLHPMRGTTLRAAIIPEGVNTSAPLLGEGDSLLPEESEEDEAELPLMQPQREAHERGDVLKASQQSDISALEGEEQQPFRGQRGRNSKEIPHTYQQSTQQQKAWKRSAAHYTSSPATVDIKYYNSNAAHTDHRQIQQQHSGNIRGKKNLSAEGSGLSFKTPAGQYVSKRMAASRGDTSSCHDRGPEPDGFSLCTEPSSSDGDDCCQRLIAGKTAGEPAIVTVNCSRKDDGSTVCKDVDALWQLIEEAVGLPPE